MDATEETLKKLYELTESTAKSPPKRTFLAWKCPQCGAKLTQESVKHMLYAGPEATEFANKVASDNQMPPGVYNLSVDHFTCKCGYQFAKQKLEAPRDSG